MNELIEIPKETALEVFTTDNGLDPYIQQITDEVDQFTPDLTTAKGRTAIASMAAKVAKSKVYLDNEGKTLVAKLKEQPRLVDAERKRMRDLLDALRDKTRKPLTDWEEAETARTDAIKQRIERMQVVIEIEAGSEALKAHLSRLESTVIDDSFAELKGAAAVSKDAMITETKKNLEIAKKREAEKAELERLQKEAAEREQKERDERLVKEAEERAIKTAADAYQKQIDAAKLAEEKSRLAALEAEKREREAKEAEETRTAQIEEDKKQAELLAQKRVNDAKKEEAERIENEARMKREIEAADKRDAEAAEKKRIANKTHIKKVNSAAILSMVKNGVDEHSADYIIKLISDGKIDHVTINY